MVSPLVFVFCATSSVDRLLRDALKILLPLDQWRHDTCVFLYAAESSPRPSGHHPTHNLEIELRSRLFVARASESSRDFIHFEKRDSYSSVEL